MDDQRPTKRLRVDFTEPLRILVGPEKKAFTVPRNMLTSRSSFFEAAAAERWRSEQSTDIALPDDEPNIFASYLHCLDQNEVLEDDGDGWTFELLIKLYCLADRVCDTETANLVMDCFPCVEPEENNFPDIVLVNLAYSSTPAGSPLRRQMVDYYLHVAKRDALSNTSIGLADASADFLRDIIIEYGRLKYNGDSAPVSTLLTGRADLGDRRRYHQYNQLQAASSIRTQDASTWQRTSLAVQVGVPIAAFHSASCVRSSGDLVLMYDSALKRVYLYEDGAPILIPDKQVYVHFGKSDARKLFYCDGNHRLCVIGLKSDVSHGSICITFKDIRDLRWFYEKLVLCTDDSVIFYHVPDDRLDQIYELQCRNSSGQGQNSAFALVDIINYAEPGEDLDWTKISEPSECKRLQGIISARKYRERRLLAEGQGGSGGNYPGATGRVSYPS